MGVENNVWGFGLNNHGELGLGDNRKRNVPTRIPDLKAKQIVAGFAHTLVIDVDDNLWSCGIANPLGL